MGAFAEGLPTDTHCEPGDDCDCKLWGGAVQDSAIVSVSMCACVARVEEGAEDRECEDGECCSCCGCVALWER